MDSTGSKAFNLSSHFYMFWPLIVNDVMPDAFCLDSVTQISLSLLQISAENGHKRSVHFGHNTRSKYQFFWPFLEQKSLPHEGPFCNKSHEIPIHWCLINHIGGFLKWCIPKIMAFNTKMVIHDLDDLGVPPWLCKPPCIGGLMGTPISQLHLCSQLGFLRRRWHNFTFEKLSILESWFAKIRWKNVHLRYLVNLI